MKKKQQVLALPPAEYHWIENMKDLEKLAEIYSKLESISAFFSHYSEPKSERPAMTVDVYGYWYIIRDICDDLAKIIKIDHWTGEIGITDDEEKENEGR